jgi:23S rRNA (uracil1939-C5)-methyltransferase
MRLAYRRVAGGVELGFRESGSHELVDIAECAVAVAPLRDRLPSLRAALAEHGGAGGEVLLLADSVGTCFASVRLRDGALVGALDRALFEAGFGGVRVESRAGAAVRGVERAMLAWQGPERSGLHPVPPHGFAQANEEVARRFAARIAALAADFSAGLGAPRRAFDLFCGAGALSIPLADAGLEVTAAESFAPSLALLRDFAAQNEWMRLRTSLVDLRDEAALRRALDDPDAGVVLDPPREGAAEVVAALARQKPPWVVYGSCDLATLARDLNELYRAGYRIRDVWGFDMFPHTGHVEVVAGLTRLELG